MTILVKNKHTLLVDEFKFRCCIGKKNTTINKKEGDKKTPKGTFEIENLYFRKDRIKKPKTLLKCIEIKEDMGWCDDIYHQKKYNKLIKLDKKLRCEKLRRKDHKYDYFIVINYNTKNIKSSIGSAIFLHLTKNYQKTLGCIALKKKDFLVLIKLIDKKTKIKIT